MIKKLLCSLGETGEADWKMFSQVGVRCPLKVRPSPPPVWVVSCLSRRVTGSAAQFLFPFDTWWSHRWRSVLEIGLPLVCCCCPGLGRDCGFQRAQAFLALALPVCTGSVQSTAGPSPGLLRIRNQSLFSGSLSHSNSCPRVGGGPPLPHCYKPSRL